MLPGQVNDFRRVGTVCQIYAEYVAARINQFLYLVILCALQACCILRGNRHFKMFIFQLIKLLFQAVIQLA